MKNWKKLTAVAFAAVVTLSSLPATAAAVLADEADPAVTDETVQEEVTEDEAEQPVTETETEEVTAASETDGEEVETDETDLAASEVQNFPGIDAPHAGEEPKQFGTIPVKEGNTSLYTYNIAWTPALEDGTFLCDTDYTAVVTITVYPGYKVAMPGNDWVAKSTITTEYLGGSTVSSYVFEKDFGKTKGHVLTKVNGTAPSTGSYGSSSYWVCQTCGKMYNDDHATKEVTIDDINGVDIMYRVYNPNSGEHFYTANKMEKDHLVSLGWHDEGIGWIAPKVSNIPVYRVYNPNAGDHHYTANKGERDYLISIGWNDEGIGWYSDEFETVPLYRQYNPNATTGTHNYTVNKAESDYLVSLGWNYEGVSWHGRAVK